MRRIGGESDDEKAFMLEDSAETFEESDVSVTSLNEDARSDSGHLEIDPKVTERSEDIATNTYSDGRGIEINPNEALNGLVGEISPNTSGATRATIFETDGTVLDSVDVSSLGSGDRFTLSASLNSGTGYFVELDAEGSSWDVGVSSEGFPRRGPAIDIVGKSVDQSGGLNNAFAILSVAPITTDAAAFIEWPQPPDVFRWDAATFQSSPDGETVEVFIEESTDGGDSWTEIQGPISRGDQIEADPGSRVRFRVELARSDTSNNPTLDAIYRRWVV